MARIKRTTIHEQIAAILRKDLRQRFQPGDKFPSQNELAERFETTPNTVREAVSALVQDGLLERRKGSGTYVSDPRLSKAVGILIEQDIFHPGTSYYFQRVVQSLRTWFKEKKLNSRLYVGHTHVGGGMPKRPTCLEFWEDVAQHRLLGVISVGTGTKENWISPLREKGIAVVDTHWGGSKNRGQGPAKTIEMGVEHLLAKGRCQLACLNWGEDPGRAWNLFKKVVSKSGGKTRKSWMVTAGTAGVLEKGAEAFDTLWRQSSRPDGLVVADDQLYHAIIPSLFRSGVRVPEELTIVTHSTKGDPRPLCFPVDRIEVDPDTHAAAQGEQLLAMLDGVECSRDEEPGSILISAETTTVH